jgi:vacuolar protein 8
MGICEVLIPLTNSPSVEVQGNSAAAIGNLSSKGKLEISFHFKHQLTLSAAEDYAPFNVVWNKPDGGLHAYLVRFLSSADITFQHIAVWVSHSFSVSRTVAYGVDHRSITRIRRRAIGQ